jgi:hypothetical protein
MAKTKTSFVVGQTGNPGGRPKGAFEARDLARKHTKAAVDRLFAIMQKGKSEQARIIAANSLLDRGWGKPTQPITSDSTVTATVKVDARATLLATLARIAEVREEAVARMSLRGSGGGSDAVGLPSAAKSTTS